METRHGLGTYVGQASLAPLIDGMAFNLVQNIGRDTRTLREMLQLREILELELVRRVTGDAYGGPTCAAGRVCRADGGGRGARTSWTRDVDRDFHDALYEPLDNHVVTLILHAFWDVQEAVASQLPEGPPARRRRMRAGTATSSTRCDGATRRRRPSRCARSSPACAVASACREALTPLPDTE